jgi:hypothetical protein
MKANSNSNFTTSSTAPNARFYQNSNYQFSLLKEEHVAQATELFIKTFCDEEPMTRYLNISYDEYRPFAQKTLEKAVRDELSTVALDKGKVVAVNIIEDLASPLVIDFPISANLEKVFAILDALSKNFLEQLALDKNKIAHYFVSAIHKDYRGINLSKVINSKSNKLIFKKGYDFIFTELTNEFSQRNAKDYHSVTLVQIEYSQYQYKGEYPFKNLKGYVASYIGKIRPQAELIYKDAQDTSNLPYALKSSL